MDKEYGVHLENTFAVVIGNESWLYQYFCSSGNTENYVIIQSNSEAIEMLRHLNKNITDNPYNDTHRGIELYKLHIPDVLQRVLETYSALFMKIISAG